MPGHGNATLKYDKWFIGGAGIICNPTSSSTNQFANRTTVTSNPQVINCLGQIASQDIILTQVFRVGAITSQAYVTEVSCIQAGSAFHVSFITASGTAASSMGLQLAWMVFHRPPLS